jgi:flagellar hook assembly protein FlgD
MGQWYYTSLGKWWCYAIEDQHTKPLGRQIDFKLSQNYPNPFNSQTSISFELEQKADVSIRIFNLNGQMVTEIFKGMKEPGYHTVNWDAGNMSAGMYIIKMEAENLVAIKKCLLLK